MAQKCTKTENICANLTPHPLLNCLKKNKRNYEQAGGRAKAVMADL